MKHIMFYAPPLLLTALLSTGGHSRLNAAQIFRTNEVDWVEGYGLRKMVQDIVKD